jgi:hypothetical protein
LGQIRPNARAWPHLAAQLDVAVRLLHGADRLIIDFAG